MSIWKWFTEPTPRTHLRIERIGLPKEMKASKMPAPGIYALRGESVVCDGWGEHQIATFTVNVPYGAMQIDYPGALSFDGHTPRPEFGTPARECTCAICGGKWFWGANYHFKDGWR